MMEDKSPAVSVIMTVYNGESYLSQSIESILNQSFKDFEFIIVNDGSTDSTEDIILSYKDSRIRYIKNTENLRICRSKNRGAGFARGHYIACMDADDVSSPCRLEKEKKYLDSHPSYGMCATRAKLMDGSGNFTGVLRNVSGPMAIAASLMFSSPLIHPSYMARTSVILENPYDPQALHVEDYDLWLRLVLGRGIKIRNLRRPLINYRWHGNNISLVNSTLQEENTRRILSPYLEDFMGRKVSAEEMDAHLFSYSLFKFGGKQAVPAGALQEALAWLETLSARNHQKARFPLRLWDGLLLSRWIVCCLYFKKILKTSLPWYNPIALFYCIYFVLSKR